MQRGTSIPVLLAVAALVALAPGCDREERAVAEVEPKPTTRPATQPATRPAEEEPPKTLTSYLDVLRDARPDYPATRPLERPVGLDEADRVSFDVPLYLDAAGNLWLSHPRGESAADVVAGDLQRQTFVTQEPVEFAWWKGGPRVELIVRRADGGHDWVHETGRASVPASDAGDYDFDRAFPVGDSLVVPTVGGAAVLTPAGRPEDPERFLRRYGNASGASGDGTVEVAAVKLFDGENPPPTEIRTDGVGLLAWVPWDDGLDVPGGTGVARHFGGAWSVLPAGDGWADRPVHLMPLADGSVLQIAVDDAGDAGDAEMRTLPLNEFTVDRAAIEQLVANLTAYDRSTRDAAFAQLSQAGAAVWPVLEELKESARPRARAEIEQLLATRDSPTLGGLIPEPGPVRVRSRLDDGGAVLAYDEGVAIPDVAGVSVLRRPAYLIVRPGKRVGPLSDLLVSELEADLAADLYAYGDELIVGGDGEGPRRFGLNHFAPVLGEADQHFDVPLGIDRLGRWLFRQSVDDTGRTLVLDVRLADPAPSLPTWVIETGELGEAGWDPADWPTMKLGGAWRLLEAGLGGVAAGDGGGHARDEVGGRLGACGRPPTGGGTSAASTRCAS